MFLKTVVLQVLRYLAILQLKKMGGKIIGITGSIGKTTCKDFLFELLKTRYRIRKTPKSLNSESGIPLAILNQESGYSDPLLWLKTFVGIFFTLFLDWRKLDYFVIEMGVDKPGDMKYLLSLIKPSAAIFLGVKPVHTEAFESFENPLLAIYQEKKKLLEVLPKGGVVVLNLDDEFINYTRAYARGILNFSRGEEDGLISPPTSSEGIYARNIKNDSSLLEMLNKNEASTIGIAVGSDQIKSFDNRLEDNYHTTVYGNYPAVEIVDVLSSEAGLSFRLLNFGLQTGGPLVESISDVSSSENGLGFNLDEGGNSLNLRFTNVLGWGFVLTLGASAVLAQSLGIEKKLIQEIALEFRLRREE